MIYREKEANIMKFNYKGVTKSGEKKKGIVDANSEVEAQSKLREINIYVYNLDKVGETKLSNPAPTPKIQPKPIKPPPLLVKVVDFEMSFNSMVIFMIKWALAAIPALIITSIIISLIFLTFSSLILSMFAGME